VSSNCDVLPITQFRYGERLTLRSCTVLHEVENCGNCTRNESSYGHLWNVILNRFHRAVGRIIVQQYRTNAITQGFRIFPLALLRRLGECCNHSARPLSWLHILKAHRLFELQLIRPIKQRYVVCSVCRLREQPFLWFGHLQTLAFIRIAHSQSVRVGMVHIAVCLHRGQERQHRDAW
jgi:hypothetical protein